MLFRTVAVGCLCASFLFSALVAAAPGYPASKDLTRSPALEKRFWWDKSMNTMIWSHDNYEVDMCALKDMPAAQKMWNYLRNIQPTVWTSLNKNYPYVMDYTGDRPDPQGKYDWIMACSASGGTPNPAQPDIPNPWS
ncbi:hypothetical protein BCV70DRAFT_48540 [Testicularia cyperi]|uniref:Uncharacterized protein n=1 Tax=Testicularia cyperi TaxID=1882483 RepID=A0A317XH84_9BASI|nr:hypothetical protein BCV70DRAFT_48540 [Testicularia cyperi]